MRKSSWIVAAALALCWVAAGAADEKATAPPNHGMVAPGDIQWQQAPAVLPAGAKLAVLEGDPAQEGIFTIRLWTPAGYKIPPHWHPAYEHVTVVSGTVGLGMGDAFDKAKGATLGAGSFAWMSPTTHHFFWAETDAVIQLHGMGPWQLYYLNPGDDPRTAKK